MEYTAINVITFVLGIIFLVNGYYLVRRGREDIALFVMSATIGIGLIFVSIFPNFFEIIAALLGIQFKTNAILIVASLTLFVLITYLFNRIGKLQHHISRLNEDMSLLKREIEDIDDD